MDHAPSLMAGDMSSCYVRVLCGPLFPRFECWTLNPHRGWRGTGNFETVSQCHSEAQPKNLVFVTP